MPARWAIWAFGRTNLSNRCRGGALIKSNGAAAGIQLGHTGRKGRTHRTWDGDGPIEKTADIPDWDQWKIVGPSRIPHGPGYPVPRALTTSEVAGLIERFGNAAVRANNAGFEVVEIHAAHGYLIHRFLSEYSNRRKDRYGGSEENRMRFLLETVEHVRGIWPAEKPPFVRLSVEDDNGWTVKESIALARLLKSKGVDAIDCSSGGFQLKSTPRTASGYKLGYQVPLAEHIRKTAEIATIAVGLIVHGDQAENIFQSGSADLIAVGREAFYKS